jgi:hypothetical protein
MPEAPENTMNQPIQEYLEQVLDDFETYLNTQPTKMARFTHAERLIGAKLFVDFLLGTPSLDPFAGRKKESVSE